MKTHSDPRHQLRIDRMKLLFGFSFQKVTQPEVNWNDIKDVISELPNLDSMIQACAPDWPIAQINKVDLSILRLAIHELKQGLNPYKVTIDEAVELAKEYGSENSAKFVNGVLGSALNEIQNESKA